MARRKNDDPFVPEDEVPTTVVVEEPPQITPEVNGSTVPNAPKSGIPGDRPILKLGPFPSGERAFLSLAIWVKNVTNEAGEVRTYYSLQIQRTYYNGPNGNEPKHSNTLRASEIQLAILLLEKAQTWIDSQK